MNVVSASRHVGMADEADSKSVDGNIVWVQVPLPALHPWQGSKTSQSGFILALGSLFSMSAYFSYNSLNFA